MPLKPKNNKPHHVAHGKEKRTKHFLKVYAPYIPLFLIVLSGMFLSVSQNLHASESGEVKSYATDMTDSGLLDSTNKMRSQQGLPALSFNKALDDAAQAKANDMARKNYWSHDTPDGKKPWDFIQASQYSYKKAAENLAYGFSSSDSTVAGWMNSESHRENILDKDLSNVGFGIANAPNYQGKGNETIVVAIYGEPSDIASPIAPSVKSADTEPHKISYLQTITDGKAPWSSFVAGLMIGLIVSYLTLKHGRTLRKKIKHSEAFVIKHPIFDLTLVALAALATILSQTVGNIY